MRLSAQRHVDQDIGVEKQNHRYFFARRRYRSSSRSAGTNAPLQRSENGEAAWRAAEEIAGIADDLLLPDGTEEFTAEHRSSDA